MLYASRDRQKEVSKSRLGSATIQANGLALRCDLARKIASVG